MRKKKYIRLEELEVYKLSREISRVAWEIFNSLSWQKKKIIGDQFIRATDSIGANIAEGYGRFHYLDKIKFFYNARGSLLEVYHWVQLMKERNIGKEVLLKELVNLLNKTEIKLNNFISVTYRNRNGKIQK